MPTPQNQRTAKQNETINVLFLLFCMLLLGFVYVNTKMNTSHPTKAKTEPATTTTTTTIWKKF